MEMTAYLSEGVGAYEQYLPLIAASCIALLLVVILWSRSTKKERGKAIMTEGERDILDRRIMADIICEGIEDRVHRGLLSKESAILWYAKFSETIGTKDLLPRQTKLLKKQVYFLKRAIKATQRNGGVAGPAKEIPGQTPLKAEQIDPKRKKTMAEIRATYVPKAA